MFCKTLMSNTVAHQNIEPTYVNDNMLKKKKLNFKLNFKHWYKKPPLKWSTDYLQWDRRLEVSIPWTKSACFSSVVYYRMICAMDRFETQMIERYQIQTIVDR